MRNLLTNPLVWAGGLIIAAVVLLNLYLALDRAKLNQSTSEFEGAMLDSQRDEIKDFKRSRMAVDIPPAESLDRAAPQVTSASPATEQNLQP